jgi:hypothetical protein
MTIIGYILIIIGFIGNCVFFGFYCVDSTGYPLIDKYLVGMIGSIMVAVIGLILTK